MSLKERITEEHSKGEGAACLTAINEKIGTCMHPFTCVLYDIRSTLDESEKVYLEIGAYRGNSSALMLSHPRPTKVIAVDCCNLTRFGRPQSQEIKANIEKICGPSSLANFTLYEGMSGSESLLKRLRKEVGLGGVDILFIDGDHSRTGVLSDWVNYRSLVRPGGLVIFDDYSDSVYSPEVKIAVDQIVTSCPPGTIEVAGCIANVNNLGLPSSVRYVDPSIGNDFIIRVL
jgi:hypothetical protein